MMMSEVALAHSGPDLFQACRFPRRSPFQSCRVATLRALTERLLAENAALKQVVADLRAGIVRLKGVTGGPAIRPSGMEQKTEPKPTDKTGKRGAKQRKTGH